MFTNLKKTCVIVGIALSLNACSSVHSTKDALVNPQVSVNVQSESIKKNEISLQQQLAQAFKDQFLKYNQFNFKSKIYVQILPDRSSSSVADLVRQLHLGKEDEQKVLQEMKLNTVFADNLLSFLTKSISINADGAMDLPNGKVEVIPDVHYQSRNAIVSVKVPMQMDLRNKKVLVDLSAVSPYIDTFNVRNPNEGVDDRELINERMLKFDLSDPKLQKKLSLSRVALEAFAQAKSERYANLDSSAVSEEAMDDFGRKNQAARRIRINMTLKSELNLISAMWERTAKILHKRVEEDAQLRLGDADDKWILNEIEHLAQKSSTDLNESDAEEENAWKTYEDIYLDVKGRIVANKSGVIVPKKTLDKMDREMNIVLEQEYLYSSHPVFTMMETPENTVNVEKIYPEFKWKELFDEQKTEESASDELNTEELSDSNSKGKHAHIIKPQHKNKIKKRIK